MTTPAEKPAQPGFAPDADPASRIEDLDAVWEYIQDMDLSGVKEKLAHAEPEELYIAWSREHLDHAEENYRKWLFLRRKYENDVMPPTVDIDGMWHGHILDTRAYHTDSYRIFGYYLHHNPYFGVGGADAQAALDTAGETTARRFREEFGEELEDWDGV